MGFLDALLGRTKPTKANLDKLFGLPSARVTLEAAEAYTPTGGAGVCFKPVAGQAFADTEAEFKAMLNLGDSNTGPAKALTLDEQADEFGYRWVVLRDEDFDELVTRVHFVNSTLEEHGYGPQLLCSVFAFKDKADSGKPPYYLVYLYKRGTFYPFVPSGSERRDNEAELRLKAELAGDIAIEPDLDRWFPIWKLPVS